MSGRWLPGAASRLPRRSLPYLDVERLDAINASAFRTTRPYPWVNPEGLLTPDGYERLTANLPDVASFERQFDLQRSHGQKSHDRYLLRYHENLDVDPGWHEFVAELRGVDYQRFLRRMFGLRPLRLSFCWQYAPCGASVSPHCDAKRKRGSHIFYMNRDSDWDPAWGGQTVILDDEGRFSRDSAPDFGDFPLSISADTSDNHSLLFARRGNSWHGVRELECPEDQLRKIFLVVIDDALLGTARRILDPLKRERRSDY